MGDLAKNQENNFHISLQQLQGVKPTKDTTPAYPSKREARKDFISKLDKLNG